MRLQNKVAIVTGGGSGFGRGIALRFAREGARIVVVDVHEPNGRETVTKIQEAGGEAVFFEVDVSNVEQMQRLLGRALGQFPTVDIVVNNAGITHRNRPMLEVTEAEFDRLYAVNVKSLFLSAQAFVPYFREQGGGVFVNIASTAAIRPRPGLTWYNGSKGAMLTISKSMAAELAPDRIRVNCVNPVMGETGLLTEFMGQDDTPEARAKFVAGIPLGRLSTPEDVANACLYLASDEASFVTGACLEVDGGRCV